MALRVRKISFIRKAFDHLRDRFRVELDIRRSSHPIQIYANQV